MADPQSFLDNLKNLRLVISVALEHTQENRSIDANATLILDRIYSGMQYSRERQKPPRRPVQEQA